MQVLSLERTIIKLSLITIQLLVMHVLFFYLFIISLAAVSEDELFGQFFGALEKIHYFKPTSDGHDDQVQLDRATRLFQNALMV